jgi:hypothetical protein
MSMNTLSHLASIHPGGLLLHHVTARLPARSQQLAMSWSICRQTQRSKHRLHAERAAALLVVEVVAAETRQHVILEGSTQSFACGRVSAPADKSRLQCCRHAAVGTTERITDWHRHSLVVVAIGIVALPHQRASQAVGISR